jgi:titin
MINNASGNTIGGLTVATGHGAGNLISGNRASGVVISGALAAGNQVQGNLIGTDTTGILALSNSSTGMTIDGASNNLIGGDQPSAGNVISANRTFGVLVLGSNATGNRIAGNLIGTNTAGASGLGNALDGLIVNAAAANTIGGPAAGSRNVISGNGGNGINILNIAGQDGIVIIGNFIGTDPSGARVVGNGLDGILLNGVNGTLIAGSALPNLVSGNRGSGIHSIGASSGSVIQGNRIGTDLSGTVSLGNGNQGVALEDFGGNTVGGSVTGQGNLISGNVNHGIRIYNPNSSSNVLVGNTIGTDFSGASPLGNGGFGISIEGTNNTVVLADLVSGNGFGGIQITGFGASGNVIYGSTIGTDRAGGTALGNGLASQNNGIGVFVNGAEGNRIGGDGAGQGNLISGNATAGVYIFGRFASGNTVSGNRIGTNATGLRPLLQSDGTPIQQVGVLINQAPGLDLEDLNPGPGNTIGGSTAGAGNLISGNVVGTMINGAESQGNVVAGNLIGPASNGGAGAGNTVGVYINGAPGNIIGGVLGNVISGNTNVGVYILGSPSTGNQVTGNIIGLGPDGTKRLSNQNGIYIENAPGNVIGGTTTASHNVISGNLITGVYILGGQSVGNVVEGNLIGFAANGRTRVGNKQYGVLLYNAPANTVLRAGPNANRITGSGIASFREFTGRRVSANPSGSQKTQRAAKNRSSAESALAQRRVVVGKATPAGPVRSKSRSR